MFSGTSFSLFIHDMMNLDTVYTGPSGSASEILPLGRREGWSAALASSSSEILPLGRREGWSAALASSSGSASEILPLGRREGFFINSPSQLRKASSNGTQFPLLGALASSSPNPKFGLDYRDSDKIVKCMSKDVPSRIRFNRAGTIPTCIEDGVRYYCMGVDAQYNELTDFAGGVKVYEQWLEGGVRETSEESLSIFNFTGAINMNILRNSVLAIHDNSNTITLFPRVEADRQRIVDEYAIELSSVPYEEIENSRVMWIPEAIFNYLIFSGKSVTSGEKVIFPKMYERVRELLLKARGAYNTLYSN